MSKHNLVPVENQVKNCMLRVIVTIFVTFVYIVITHPFQRCIVFVSRFIFSHCLLWWEHGKQLSSLWYLCSSTELFRMWDGSVISVPQLSVTDEFVGPWSFWETIAAEWFSLLKKPILFLCFYFFSFLLNFNLWCL